MASPAEPNSRPLIIPDPCTFWGIVGASSLPRARAAWRGPICSGAMERGKVSDVATLLADLRERVRELDERVETLGRHL